MIVFYGHWSLSLLNAKLSQRQPKLGCWGGMQCGGGRTLITTYENKNLRFTFQKSEYYL